MRERMPRWEGRSEVITGDAAAGTQEERNDS